MAPTTAVVSRGQCRQNWRVRTASGTGSTGVCWSIPPGNLKVKHNLNLKGLGSMKVPHSSRCFVGYPTSQVQEVLSNPVLMMSARYLDGDVTQPLVSSLFCSIQVEVVDAGLVCESLWFQVVSLLCRHCEGVMRAVQRSSWCLPTSSRRTTTKRTPETLCAPWPFSGESFKFRLSCIFVKCCQARSSGC